MKKLLSFFLLLSISSPALPMQRTKDLIDKYGGPTLQIATGATILGLYAYGAYCAYKEAYPYEKLPKLHIDGLEGSTEAGTFCGNLPCWRISSETGNITKMIVNNKVYNNLSGHTFCVGNNTLIADGKLIEGIIPCASLKFHDLLGFGDNIWSKTFVTYMALKSASLLAIGIQNFKAAYNSRQ